MSGVTWEKTVFGEGHGLVTRTTEFSACSVKVFWKKIKNFVVYGRYVMYHQIRNNYLDWVHIVMLWAYKRKQMRRPMIEFTSRWLAMKNYCTHIILSKLGFWSSLPKFPKSFELQTSINSFEILMFFQTSVLSSTLLFLPFSSIPIFLFPDYSPTQQHPSLSIRPCCALLPLPDPDAFAVFGFLERNLECIF